MEKHLEAPMDRRKETHLDPLMDRRRRGKHLEPTMDRRKE
jgi:hypothetical protein